MQHRIDESHSCVKGIGGEDVAMGDVVGDGARGRTCATCRAWRPHGHVSTVGQCRRHAPSTPHYRWPDTLSHEWCEEHLPSEAPR